MIISIQLSCLFPSVKEIEGGERKVIKTGQVKQKIRKRSRTDEITKMTETRMRQRKWLKPQKNTRKRRIENDLGKSEVIDAKYWRKNEIGLS